MVQLAVIVAFVVVWLHFQTSSAQLTQMSMIALLLTLHHRTDALAARSASKRLRPAAEPEDDSEGMSEDVSDNRYKATSALRPVKRWRAAVPLDSRSVSERRTTSDALGQSVLQGASSDKLRKGARGTPAPGDVVRADHTLLPACHCIDSNPRLSQYIWDVHAEAVQAATQPYLKILQRSCANQRAYRAQLLFIFKRLVPSNTPEAPSIACLPTRGPSAGSGSDSEDGDQSDEAPSAPRPAKRQRAATPASSSVSAASAGSDPAAMGVSEGTSSDVLRKGDWGYPAPSEAVCAR